MLTASGRPYQISEVQRTNPLTVHDLIGTRNMKGREKYTTARMVDREWGNTDIHMKKRRTRNQAAHVKNYLCKGRTPPLQNPKL